MGVWVDGEPDDPKAVREAVAIFQIVLGVLRASLEGAGQLADEYREGLGQGSVRDRQGTQWVMPASTVGSYEGSAGLESAAENAGRWIELSRGFQNALWLNGRPNRTAADHYMIHEYAMLEFGGTRGIEERLGFSVKDQSDLTVGANNLSPLEGGRHAGANQTVALSLAEQAVLSRELLRLWIASYGEVGAA